MPQVAFLRASNVGGKNAFRPAQVAARLADLETANVGAAGTFVVRKEVPAEALRRRILAELPFQTDIMVCSGSELAAVATACPGPSEPEVQRFLTVLSRDTGTGPALPVEVRKSGTWEVRIVHRRGGLVVTERNPAVARARYPNEVVESTFAQPATTRGWPTFLSILRLLQEKTPAASPSRRRS